MLALRLGMNRSSCGAADFLGWQSANLGKPPGMRAPPAPPAPRLTLPAFLELAANLCGVWLTLLAAREGELTNAVVMLLGWDWVQIYLLRWPV